MNLQPGQVFAEKYRIVRLIGQGGMGTVFEGENVRIRRKVAIKTLHASVAEKRDVVTRFEREAQAAGRIGSSHIVEVLDLGDLPDGSRFMVMEFLEGSTLEQRIRSRGRLTPAEAVPVVAQMLDGLAAAHHAGIIHRDLKPANVFLLASKGGQPDFVKILDFGVSKFNVLATDEMSMTRTGSVVGTPFYMSPEQAKGSKGLDGRSDLYAAGVILYECITGQVPFHAETFNELIFKIVLESPPPAESFVPDLEPAFAAIIRKAMSRDVGERFQGATEFKQTLVDWAAKNAHGLLPGPGGTTAVLPAGAHIPFPMRMSLGHPGGAPSPPGGYAASIPGPPAASGGFVGVDEPVTVPKKSAGALVGGIAFIAVLGLGAGGFAAYRWSEARAAAAEAEVDGAEISAAADAADDDESTEEAASQDEEDADDEDDEPDEPDEEDSDEVEANDPDATEGDEGAAASAAPKPPGAPAVPGGGFTPPPPISTLGSAVGKGAPTPTLSPPKGNDPPGNDGAPTIGGDVSAAPKPPRTVSGEL